MSKPVYFPSMSRNESGIVVPNDKLYFAFADREFLIVPAPTANEAASLIQFVNPLLSASVYKIRRINRELLNEHWSHPFGVIAQKASLKGLRGKPTIMDRDDSNVSGYHQALWLATRQGAMKRQMDTLYLTQGRVIENASPIAGVEVYACHPLLTPQDVPVTSLTVRIYGIL